MTHFGAFSEMTKFSFIPFSVTCLDEFRWLIPYGVLIHCSEPFPL